MLRWGIFALKMLGFSTTRTIILIGITKHMFYQRISAIILFAAFSINGFASECSAPDANVEVLQGDWGNGLSNHRYQSNTQINSDNAGQLKLKWVFSLGDHKLPHSYPAISTDTVYFGSPEGFVYALDKVTGCQRWKYEVGDDIRTGIGLYLIKDKMSDIKIPTLIFGGEGAWVYALNAVTGELLWKYLATEHPFGMMTGTPAYHNGVVYIPVSSFEMILSVVPFFSCCNFSGALVAVDGLTGKRIWSRNTIDEQATLQSRTILGVARQGPSGASVWSQPAIVPELGLALIGTSENYTYPATDDSDAIIAIDLKTGEKIWQTQLTLNDVWNFACEFLIRTNCPKDHGPDFDFGAPPVYAQLKDGQKMIFAGQKSGYVYALDANNGDLIWSNKLGRGGKLGGIHWGIAFDSELELVVVPISDRAAGTFLDSGEGEAKPGVAVLDAGTGKIIYQQIFTAECLADESCFAGISAAITLADGISVMAGLDGILRILNTATGIELWRFDSMQTFSAVNGSAYGGSFDVHGAALAADQLMIFSGYGAPEQQPGNALLVFELSPKAEVFSCDVKFTNPRPSMCSAIYDPVCATFKLGDTANKTFSSDCMACSDLGVDSYVKGQCE
jgi:polyvinyl alcohol dehydrogenase (cytochrome)